MCMFGLDNMAKMSTGPYVDKKRQLKNLLLHNNTADCFEAWYVASKALVLQSYLNYVLGLTFIYFMSWSKLVAQAFE